MSKYLSFRQLNGKLGSEHDAEFGKEYDAKKRLEDGR